MYQSTEDEYIQKVRENLEKYDFLKDNFGIVIDTLLRDQDPLRNPIIRWLAINAHIAKGLNDSLKSTASLKNASSFFRNLANSLQHYPTAPENFRAFLAESYAARWALHQKLPFSLLKPDEVEFAPASQELYDLVFIKGEEKRLVSVKTAEEFNPTFALLSDALNYEELFNPLYRRTVDIQVRITTKEENRRKKREVLGKSVNQLIHELNVVLVDANERTERLRISDNNCEFYVRYGKLIKDGHLFLGVFGDGAAPLPQPLSHARMIAHLGHDLVPYTRLLYQEFLRSCMRK